MWKGSTKAVKGAELRKSNHLVVVVVNAVQVYFVEIFFFFFYI